MNDLYTMTNRWRSRSVQQRSEAIRALSLLIGTVLIILPACSTIHSTSPYRPSVAVPLSAPDRTIRLAALLPLSGQFGRYGKEALQGIDLAMEDAKQTGDMPPVELVIKDSAVGKINIGDMLEEVVRESAPLAVIGPLFSMEIEHVARRSRQLQVPVITPSATLANVHAVSPYVFSTALTFPLQAQAIAQYAMQAGYRRICVIAPESGYGRRLGRLLAEEMQRLGGDIISEQWYGKGESDFSVLIKQLKAMDLKHYGHETTNSQKDKRKKIYAPGFDAIFLPGDYREVLLIATQLKFYGIKVPLLGSNAWNNNDLDRYSDRALAGAVFIDSFFSPGRNGNAYDLIKACKIHYGTAPSMFVVHSYEAAKIILQAVRHGAKSGKDIRHYFETTDTLYSLRGPTSFNDQGILNRRMFFMQMNQAGRPVLLN